jgi:hypothetical protein
MNARRAYRFTHAALLALVLFWLGAQAPAHCQTTPSKSPGHYFLVVDHSGSMLTRISKGAESGRTRWDLMRERAAGFADRLPQGAEAWAVVFDAPDRSNPGRDWYKVISARLDSPESRGNFTGMIKSFPEPGPANGTWLYQATDMALEQAEKVGARDPEAYLTILVYTDGVDEGHGRTRAEILQNPGSTNSHCPRTWHRAAARLLHRTNPTSSPAGCPTPRNRARPRLQETPRLAHPWSAGWSRWG